jgi:transposase-like protein
VGYQGKRVGTIQPSKQNWLARVLPHSFDIRMRVVTQSPLERLENWWRLTTPPRRIRSLFKPPFCPRRSCSQHLSPALNFYTRHGSFHPQCRPRPVPRFRCRKCRRTFSRQTFRLDYRDHRPHLNALLFNMITSGVGIRQCSRVIGLTRRCTELKLRKISRHARQLNLNLRGSLPLSAGLHFDEFESYEGQRNTRPLSIPMLIETHTRYLIWAESAPIRPNGTMTDNRVRAIARSEQRHGVRRNTSSNSIRRTLDRGASMLLQACHVTLHTDEKSTYPNHARMAFGTDRLTHLRTNSKKNRDTRNPLFPINHEEARARDLMGRLRRQSWLGTKKRRYLDLSLQLYAAYRNLVGCRFNTDKASPAQLLGFVSQRLRPEEVLSWRQIWARRSLHPLLGGEGKMILQASSSS